MPDTDRLLAATTISPDDPALQRVRQRLERGAEERGLADVNYRVVDTPLGPLLVMATAHGLVRLAFDCEDHGTVLASVADLVSPRLLRAGRRLDPALTQLEEYFDNRRRSFELPLDLQLAHGFRRVVLERLRTVTYGHTINYSTLAAEVDNPRAVRAVGSACATNPLPIVIPCHRVLRSDGALGGYRGGPEAKQFLLTLEQSH